jgi:hypothetical protein
MSGSSHRDVKGRDQFKFFHNTQATSSSSLGDTNTTRYPAHGRSRLNDSTTSSSSNNTTIVPIIIRTEPRPTSANDSSSTVSSMELSTNPHTPPTSIDQHFNPHPQDTPNSATSTYSDDLPLPPLLPHNVKRADSPTAFTSRFPAQVPWAQRSTIKDIREASNLRWATSSRPSTPPPSAPPIDSKTPTAAPNNVEPPRTPPPKHRRKRSMTAPSVFDNAQKPSVRPESGTLPLDTPSPPRPPRHPKRQTRAPPPIPLTMEMPVAVPYSYNPPSTSTPTSREDVWTTPLSSPMPQSPALKAPSAFYKPTMPLRSVGSAQSLRPGSRRPSTAPTQGSPLLSKPAQIGVHPSPPSSGNRGFDRLSRLSRNPSASSATRGGWI